MAIKLLVDSCCDISQQEAKEMGIIVMPLLVTIDGVDFDMPNALLYTGNDTEKLEKYKEYNSELWEGKNIRTLQIGCSTGTQAGPGAVGIAYFVK